MQIPIPKIPINLLPDTPSTVNPEDLRKELNNVGLTCVETTVEKLIVSKEEVLNQMNAGSFQGYQFYHMANAQQIAQNLKNGQMLTSLEQVVSVDNGLHAEWKPDGTTPYSKFLYVVGQSDHFDYLTRNYNNFGGQQQRVAIARALAGEPAVILADEPTGALDSQTGREVLDILRQLNQEGRTVVLITHDNAIARQAQRIIRLEDGKIVYDGTADAPEAVVAAE